MDLFYGPAGGHTAMCEIGTDGRTYYGCMVHGTVQQGLEVIPMQECTTIYDDIVKIEQLCERM